MESPVLAQESTPGQFVMVACKESGLLLRRPMSIYRTGRQALHLGGANCGIHSAAGSNSVPPTAVSLLYEVRGRGTRWLAERQPGDVLDVVGPLGNGFQWDPQGTRHLLVVAGGIGLGGVLALVDSALEQGSRVRLLYGAATASKLVPLGFFHPGLELFHATDDGSSGHKGFVTQLIQRHIFWAGEVFACGPVPMFAAMARLWKNNQWTTPAQALMEARMGCGLGACYGCSVETVAGYRRVCTNGPKYDLQELVFQSEELPTGKPLKV
jgi:dihydroorotate dehydrogenase electron transfer subunit